MLSVPVCDNLPAQRLEINRSHRYRHYEVNQMDLRDVGGVSSLVLLETVETASCREKISECLTKFQILN